MANKKMYWTGHVGMKDDFGDPITDTIIDGKSKQGPWGIFTPKSYRIHSWFNGELGLGKGQMYKLQLDGKWLKIEG